MKKITQAQFEATGRFVDELPRVTRISPNGGGPVPSLTITQKTGSIRVHSMLPKVPMWTYEGIVPGPCIETRVGQTVAVRHRNRLSGMAPLLSVRAEDADQLAAGREAGVIDDPDAMNLEPTTVVHLHGGRTEADSDGWTENVIAAGESRVVRYRNDQSAMYWFHDHAAMVTRLNVFAGLAGVYMVRGAIDAKLPKGDREIVLVVQDRNLDTDSSGYLAPRLLHKTADKAGGPMEFFGPFNLVNGTIWPDCTVKPAQHRLRMVNGSNARTYRLTLVDAAGARCNSRITQIGTDGGLLPIDPAATPAVQATMGPFTLADGDPIVLAPGERIDLIADFRGVTGPLRLVNEAAAPYGNDVAPVDLATGNATDPQALRANVADVIRFTVTGTANDTFDLATVLASGSWPTYTRYDHDTPPFDNHMHRAIGLVENPDTGVLTLNELWKPGDAHTTEHLGNRAAYLLRAPYVTVAGTAGPVTLATAASAFDDAITYMIERDGYELWKIYNLTADTHPFHVHLVQFQVLARTSLSWAASPAYPDGNWAPAANVDPTGAANQVVTLGAPTALERADTGWKDTVRINPGEMLTIMARFDGHAGRYMYHCHILEHEDHDMMRPFVVVPQGRAHGHM